MISFNSMFCILPRTPLNHALWHYSFMFRQIQREGRDTDSLDWCQDREYETTDALVSTDIALDENELRRVTVGTHTKTEQTHTWLCRYRERQSGGLHWIVAVAIFWQGKLFPSDVISLLLCRPPISSLNKTKEPAPSYVVFSKKN